MPDDTFFYVGRSGEQPVELFINLANVTKLQWDGSTMNVFFAHGDNAYVYGEPAVRLREAVMHRCLNRHLVPAEG